jgi:hypothetical protein
LASSIIRGYSLSSDKLRQAAAFITRSRQVSSQASNHRGGGEQEERDPNQNWIDRSRDAHGGGDEARAMPYA